MSMAATRNIGVGLLAVAVLGGLLLAGDDTRPPELAADLPALTYDLTPGQQFTFALAFNGEQELPLGQMGMDRTSRITSSVVLDAEVEVTVLEEDQEGWVLSWTVAKVDDIELSMGALGSIAEAEARAAFEGQSVEFSLRRDGVVDDVAFSDETPIPFRKVAKIVIAETQVPAAAGRSWDVVERAGLGRVETSISNEGRVGDAVHIAKERDRYLSLAALPGRDVTNLDQAIAFEGDALFDGYVVSVQSSEESEFSGEGGPLFSANRTVSWRRTGTRVVALEARDPEVLAQQRHVALDEVAPNPELKESLEAAAAGDIRFDDIADYIARLDLEHGFPEDHSSFVVQAVAFLELHPERCRDLLPLFVSDLTTGGRGLVLDLLAFAGHPTAQGVMVEALSSEVARATDEEYTVLMQRISRVEEPTADTAAFAWSEFERVERKNERVATAYTVGAVVRKLDDGEVSKSEMYGGMLEALQTAEDPQRRTELLMALSNAGQPENVEVALRFAGDPSADVRRAAAMSLGRLDGQRANLTLASFARDDDEKVQRAALRTLRGHTLDEPTLEKIFDVVFEEGVGRSAYADVYRLLEEAPASQDRRDAAAFLAERIIGDPYLKGKLDTMASS